MLKPFTISSLLLLVVFSFALQAGAGKKSALGGSASTLSQHNDTNITYYGITPDVNRFSPLEQINLDTIDNLTPVWSLALGETMGLQTQPLIVDGVMYVTTHNSTHAIEALTGRQIWKLKTEYAKETLNCCGFGNRGLSYFNGKIYRANLDNRLMAIDPANGDILWEQEVIDPALAYSMTSAPLIANGVLITGIAGSEFGAPGFLDGWDPETGKHLWRFNTIPKPGEAGSETWTGDAWRTGGGGTWITGSYDSDLDLVYWGAANPAPWSAKERPGDNLFTNTMLALRPKTGELVWHFQFTPNGTFDHDGNNEPLLAELKIGGKKRKVLMQANRNGFFYVLDRTNGKFIKAHQFVDKQNWTDGIDKVTGRPTRSKLVEDMLKTGDEVNIWPSALGGKNVAPVSYSAETGLAYVNSINRGWAFQPLKPDYRLGTPYFAANYVLMQSGRPFGALIAIDPRTGKIKWRYRTEVPMNGGTLVTAGNIVFTGAQTGEFYAFNAKSGKKLWEYRTSSGILAPPVTYLLDGTQYVAVASGFGGLYSVVGEDDHLKNINHGGAIWVFALGESTANASIQAATLLPPPSNVKTTKKIISASVDKGHDLFNQNCAFCHGRDMSAGDTTFDLKTFPKNDKPRFVSAIVNGKSSMPAWGDKLSSEEIDLIYSYVTH